MSRYCPDPTRATVWLPHAVMAVACAAALPAQAYVVTIAAGTRALYLQVGVGQFTGTFSGGGTPGSNATVNQVSVTVPPAGVGTGPLAMTTNSTVTNSPYDNFNFCTVPAQVYVGGFYRNSAAGAPATARLQVASPTTLTSAAGDTIPITAISWASGGTGDATPTIPSGTFAGGTQTLYTANRNTWFESCLQFNYANSAVVPAGTFTGRVTYTLSAP